MAEKGKRQKYRIRPGAHVGMDFRQWVWPEVPYGDANIVFDCDVDFFRNRDDTFQRCDCCAYKFGQRDVRDGYGSGSLFVSFEDLIPYNGLDAACPFCGSVVRWCGEDEPEAEDVHECHMIYCDYCHAQFDLAEGDRVISAMESVDAMRHAIAEKWNRRAETPNREARERRQQTVEGFADSVQEQLDRIQQDVLRFQRDWKEVK